MRARCGKKPCRLGLMAAGSELPLQEFLCAARDAMEADPALRITGLGPLPEGPLPDGLDWQETENSGAAAAAVMDALLAEGRIEGAVALHYPFPMGVTTIGRMTCPASGRPMFMASSTGMSAPPAGRCHAPQRRPRCRCGQGPGPLLPVLGVLNLEAAPPGGPRPVAHGGQGLSRAARGEHPPGRRCPAARQRPAVRGRGRLRHGYPDRQCPHEGLCVLHVRGARETCGWGYGPSVGEGWDKVISIVSRASGAPVIAGALRYTAGRYGQTCPGRSGRSSALPLPRAWKRSWPPWRPPPVPEEAVLRRPSPPMRNCTASTCWILRPPSTVCGGTASMPRPPWAARGLSSNCPPAAGEAARQLLTAAGHL